MRKRLWLEDTKGSNNRNAKLSESIVAELKKRKVAHDRLPRDQRRASVEKLGVEFGVAPQTIWDAWSGRRWRNCQ